MNNRREFLGMMAATLGAAALAQGAKPKAKLAAMLYSIGAYIHKNGLEKTLVQLAEIGYKGVEFQVHFGLKAEEIRRMLAGAGLEVVASHVACRDFAPDRLQSVCEFHRGYGNRLLICADCVSYMRKGEDPDEYAKRLVEYFNLAACQAASYGCQVGLHNHRFEIDLTLKDGTTLWDYFFAHTDKRVCMEQDVGWTTCTGEDPCQYWRRYPHRSVGFHAKEDNGWKYAVNGRDVKKFDGILGEPAQPGARGVDWGKVATAADADGIPWWIVECEKHFESLDVVRKSYEFLRKRGRA